MPMKLTMGVQRKVGQPNYGSLGASCSTEVELSESLVFVDPEAFQQCVRQTFAACEHAVDEQPSTRQSGTGHQGNGSSNGNSQTHSHTQWPVRNNVDSDVARHNGNPAAARQATEKQICYIRQLAEQIHALGVRKLEGMAQDMFGKPLAGLTSPDASGMIDCLKGIKDAELDLQAVPDGDAT